MAVNPSAPKSSAPLVKNVASAPFVFFDAAPVFGVNAGVVQVALTANATSIKADKTVGVDMVAVAHLRGSLQAAVSLRDALDQAIAMASRTTEEKKQPN